MQNYINMIVQSAKGIIFSINLFNGQEKVLQAENLKNKFSGDRDSGPKNFIEIALTLEFHQKIRPGISACVWLNLLLYL